MDCINKLGINVKSCGKEKKIDSSLIPKGCDLANYLSHPVQDIFDNSKKVTKGSIFIAVGGSQTHGGEYIVSINEAMMIFVDSDYSLDSISFSPVIVPIIAVDGLKQKLPNFVKWFFDKVDEQLSLIGITGTNGKTSVMYYLASFFSAKRQVSIAGTLGYGIFGEDLVFSNLTSLGLIDFFKALKQFRSKGIKLVITEVSSHAIKQGRFDGIKFIAKILTNIKSDHLDYHKSIRDYQETKLSFIKGCGKQIINYGDKTIANLTKNFTEAKDRYFYASQFGNNSTADYEHKQLISLLAKNIECTESGIQFMLEDYLSQNNATTNIRPQTSITLSIPLYGLYVVENFLAAWLCFRIIEEDVGQTAINDYGQRLVSPKGRLQKVADKPIVFIDFAHTADGLLKSLQSLRLHFPKHELWAVFGAGGDRDKSKRPLMGKVADKYCSKIIITNDNPRTEEPIAIAKAVMAGIKKKKSQAQIILDRKQAIEYAITKASLELTPVVVLLAGKGHEQYQIFGDKKIDFDEYAIVKNVCNFKIKTVE